MDLDIIRYVCDLIENNIKQTETKSIDKKQIVVGIITKCIPLNAQELLILNKMIEFLHSNHLITKISKIEKTGSKLFSWAVKKLIWNGINNTLDRYNVNIYKNIKIKSITTVLTKLLFKKKLILLIIAFI